MELVMENIGLKIAGALLIKYGELSVRDIQAIPFFSDSPHIETVIEYLTRFYNAEIYTKRIASSTIPEWEQIIRLRK